MLTAIALTGALFLLAATEKMPTAAERPWMMQVSPKVDDGADDIAYQQRSLPALNWLISLHRELRQTSHI